MADNADATIPSDTEAGRLLTPKEAAVYLSLSDQSLANMRSKGGGPPYFKVGKYVRYDEHDLHAWMRSRRYTSTSHETSEKAV